MASFSSFVASGGKYASTLTSSRTDPMTPSTCELASSPKPSTTMQMNVVVMAVMLMRKLRRMFLNASRKKKPKLNLVGIGPPYLVPDHAPLLEGHYPLAHHVHHLLVVGGDEDGGADAVDPVQELHDAYARVRVEVARRLVGYEDLRLRDEGPGDGDALLLPAREHVRVLVHLRREAHEVEDLGHLRADRAPPLARDLHRVGHVLGGGLVRQQLEVLEDRPDVAPVARDLAPRDGREPGPLDVDSACGGFDLLEDKAHHRGLARAARSDQEDELSVLYLQVHLLERDRVFGVQLRDVVESDHYLSRCGSPDVISASDGDPNSETPLQGLSRPRETIPAKKNVINRNPPARCSASHRRARGGSPLPGGPRAPRRRAIPGAGTRARRPRAPVR